MGRKGCTGNTSKKAKGRGSRNHYCAAPMKCATCGLLVHKGWHMFAPKRSCSCATCGHTGCEGRKTAHCVVCRRPGCGAHCLPLQAVEGCHHACEKCSHELSLLAGASDFHRVEKLLSELYTRAHDSAEEDVVVHILINGSHDLPLRVRHQSKQEGNVILQRVESWARGLITTGSTLHARCEVTAHEVVSDKMAPVLHYPAQVTSVEVSVFPFELLFVSSTMNLQEPQLAALLQSNQPQRNSTCKALDLPFILDKAVHFYQSVCTSPFSTAWAPREEALIAHQELLFTMNIMKKFGSVLVLTDPLQIGTQLAHIARSVHDEIKARRPVLLPVSWMQEISSPPGDRDNSSLPEHRQAQVVLWVHLIPTSESTCQVSFVNTADVLAPLFPSCSEAHVPIQSRVMKEWVAAGKSSSLPDSEPGTARNDGMRPGFVGTVNKLDFLHVSIDHLDRVVMALLLMQLSSPQRQAAGAQEQTQEKLLSLATKSEEDDDEGEVAHDDPLSLGISTLKQLPRPGLRQVIEATSRATLGLNGHLAYEEDLCDSHLSGRSFLDGRLLEGHAVDVLEAIFATLREAGATIEPDSESVYPLVPGISLVESFRLYEKFTMDRSQYLGLSLMRALFLMRSCPARAHSNLNIWADTAQRIFTKAMGHPPLLASTTPEQSRILRALKESLDLILQTKELMIKRLSLEDMAGSVDPMQPHSYQIKDSIAACWDDALYGLPTTTVPACYPPQPPSQLRERWNDLTYAEFDALWTSWMNDADRHMSNQDQLSLRRTVYWMIESVPPDWSSLMLKFSSAANDPNAHVGGRLWINRWSVILSRLFELLAHTILSKLSSLLLNSETMKKYGLTPVESFGLIKLNVALDRLYCLSESDGSSVPPFPLSSWMMIIECFTADHYLHYTTQQNQELHPYLEYIRSRSLASPLVTEMVEVWSHSSNSASSPGHFDRDVLKRIAGRARAFYGGSIPHQDSWGHVHMTPDLAVAFSREEGKYNYQQEIIVGKCKQTYDNLRTPDAKSGYDAAPFKSLLEDEGLVVDEVYKFQPIGPDEQWKSTRPGGVEELCELRLEADKWLCAKYSKFLSMCRNQAKLCVEQSAAPSGDLSKLLLKRLAAKPFSGADVPMWTKAREGVTQKEVCNADFAIMLALSTAPAVQALECRQLCVDLLRQLRSYELYLLRRTEELAHSLCRLSLQRILGTKTESLLFALETEIDTTLPAAVAETARRLVALPDGVLSPHEMKGLQPLCDMSYVHQIHPSCFATFFRTFSANQVEPQPCKTLLECIQIMEQSFFEWKLALELVPHNKRQFVENRETIETQMALVSPTMRCFWPPALLGVRTTSTVTQLLLHPRGKVFFSSLAESASALSQATWTYLSQGMSSVWANGFSECLFPSSRQFDGFVAHVILQRYQVALQSSLPMVSSLAWRGPAPGFITRIRGALGVRWKPYIQLETNSAIGVSETWMTALPPSSSHYCHGVQLPKAVRNQLIRAGLSTAKHGYTSLKMLAESVPILPALSGEVDLCQDMRFDQNSVQWMRTHDVQLACWDATTGSWDSSQEHPHLILFHRLRNQRTPQENVKTHWDRELANDAPTLIHSIMGELNADRIMYLLTEPALQRVFELKLFRPSLLSFVCRLKPVFVQTMIKVFRHAITAQHTTLNLPGELYLRYLLFRIGCELEHMSPLPHIKAVCDKIVSDPQLSLQPRICKLIDELSTSSPQDQIRAHQFAISRFYLLWLRQTSGYQLTVSNPGAPLMLLTLATYRTTCDGLTETEVDKMESTSLEDWAVSLFQLWKPELLSSGVPTPKMHQLLLPMTRYFVQEQRPLLMEKLQKVTWMCDGEYPTFSAQLGNTLLTIAPASGFLFLDHQLQTFIRPEHMAHDVYQQYFGARSLTCSLVQKAGWFIYRFPLQNQITCSPDEYTIRAHLGEMQIYRKLGQSSRWYQFLPNGLSSVGQLSTAARPGFITGSDAWYALRQYTMFTSYKVYLSSRVCDPQRSVVHHSAICTPLAGEEISLSEIQRLPSLEPVWYLPASSIPASLLAFEHSWFIEYAAKNLYLPRFALSFHREAEGLPWQSVEFSGYNLSEGRSVNPFHDESAYWLTLERTETLGHVSYLLLAACFPLEPHPVHDEDVLLSQIRRGSRSVWVDYQLELSTLPYLLLKLDPEAPTVLRTSSASGLCWLILLYLAKRDYSHCMVMIDQVNFDTHLVSGQLQHLHRILHWHDNSRNACTIKMKIIAGFARNDPNLLCTAESSRPQKDPTGLPVGRFPHSLLGMTQEEFFDFYLFTMMRYPEILTLSSASTELTVGGTLILLSSAEKQYIDRVVRRWPEGLTLSCLSVERMRSIRPISWPSVRTRLEEACSAISSASDITLLDVAFNILKEDYSYKSDENLFSQVLPMCLGRPSSRWSAYFASIYSRLLALPSDSDELKRWAFFLSCEPFAGDRLARWTRILLCYAAFARLYGVGNLKPLKLPAKTYRASFGKMIGLGMLTGSGIQHEQILQVHSTLDCLQNAISLCPSDFSQTSSRLLEQGYHERLTDVNSFGSLLETLSRKMDPASGSPAGLRSAAASIEQKLVQNIHEVSSPSEGSIEYPAEVKRLEEIIQGRLDYMEKAKASSTPLYDVVSVSYEKLPLLAQNYLYVESRFHPAQVWQERGDELFNERHYPHQHHKESARSIQNGFENALKIPHLAVKFQEPEAEKVRSLVMELYTLRAAVEQQEATLLAMMYDMLQRPGTVEGSIVCSTQAVPLAVILNAWENNQLDRLYDCYGCVPFTETSLKEFNMLVEKIDVLLCWRQHIATIISKVKEAAHCTQPLEKAALLETLYHLFNETMCYEITTPPTAAQNRKILAISRTNGFLARSRQVEIVNKLLVNPNQAIQAALGLGKSSVIVPLTTSALSDGVRSIWVMCPLTDKPETIHRCEQVRNTFNHPLLIFHFINDGTHLQDDSGSAQRSLVPPYRLDGVDHLRELYYDLLLNIKEQGVVVTTRESLLYFVDTYEQLWINRSRQHTVGNGEQIQKCDELIYWFSKFFPIFKKHGRAIMDEIDVILKANVKVNIALSDMAKINRDTLDLAVRAVQLLLDPTEFITYEDPELGSLRCPLPKVFPLMSNCQAAVSSSLKTRLRHIIAERLGDDLFDMTNQPTRDAYLAFVLCSDRKLSEQFFEQCIRKHPHPCATNIVRLRELLGGSFATLFKRHNYSLGRMFTNDNKDDVGPYSAANRPLKNSHLSSEYDWVWALAANYAMTGITQQQICRQVNLVREEYLAQHMTIDDQTLLHEAKPPLTDNNNVREFESIVGFGVTEITSSMLPLILERINHLGDWTDFDAKKICAAKAYLQSNPLLREAIYETIPELFVDHLSKHQIPNLVARLFYRTDASEKWPELLRAVAEDRSCGSPAEADAAKNFSAGIRNRLNFLKKFVNLTSYPSFIEGNATTLVHIFGSVCGFSGTMEAPHTLPQLVFKQSSPELLRDRSIDGIVLSRFLSYALQSGSGHDTTRFVDEAALQVLQKRLPSSEVNPVEYAQSDRTREVLLATFNALAIVDGGALLDVDPQDVISCLVQDSTLRHVLNDPNKPDITMIRWKEDGHWTTFNLQTGQKQLQSDLADKVDLNTLLTFYDQEHSRGTDAKLAPDALMVNTVGDATSLTEWSQSEGRARQSGKGQTSKSIIAPHIRSQLNGEGPLAIRMLRILIQRSSDAEVSEAFYAHAEQIRSYVRDHVRSGLANYHALGPIPSDDERKTLGVVAEELFVQQCDADLSKRHILMQSARPQEYTSSSQCLAVVIQQEQARIQQWQSRIREFRELSPTCQCILQQSLCDALSSLQEHVVPPSSALPAGEIGIPRPGEQSFGISLSTEIEQEQAVEVETELEVENEVEVSRQDLDPEALRPSWKDWKEKWYSSSSGFWKALETDFFVSLRAFYPHLYKHQMVSPNLGFWVPSEVAPSTRTEEEDFYWLHETFVDPFVYHVVLQFGSQLRAVTISHAEYSQYLFPLLNRLDKENGPDRVKISVYRFGSYGWVLVDSTVDDNLNPWPVSWSHNSLNECLAEFALTSGHLEIGTTAQQVGFLQLFFRSGIESSPLCVDYAVGLMGDQLQDFLPAETFEIWKTLTAMMKSLQLVTDWTHLTMRSLPEEVHPQLQAMARQQPDESVCNVSLQLERELANLLGSVVVQKLLQGEDAWHDILQSMFGSEEVQQAVRSAKQQIRVITGRHRPGKAKKLEGSLMWQILHALIQIGSY